MNLLPTDIDLDASADTLRRYDGHTQTLNGRKVWKSKDDLARYEHIIRRDRPELLIETGTRWAGFACWVAETFEIDVITIDLAPVYEAPLTPRVTALHADSTDEKTIAAVNARTQGRRTMVSLDADHHAGPVILELQGYAGLVAPGCALVVEDTLADYVGGWVATQIGNHINAQGGPMAGVNLLISDPRFERDLEAENLSTVSHSPAGWWRRTDV